MIRPHVVILPPDLNLDYIDKHGRMADGDEVYRVRQVEEMNHRLIPQYSRKYAESLCL